MTHEATHQPIHIEDLVVEIDGRRVIDGLSLERRAAARSSASSAPPAAARRCCCARCSAFCRKRRGSSKILGLALATATRTEARAIGRAQWRHVPARRSVLVAHRAREHRVRHARISCRVRTACSATSHSPNCRWSGLNEADSEKLPSALSGGMTKRAALARALALDPELDLPRRADLGPRPHRSRRFRCAHPQAASLARPHGLHDHA